jgi:hypothetical protein
VLSLFCCRYGRRCGRRGRQAVRAGSGSTYQRSWTSSPRFGSFSFYPLHTSNYQYLTLIWCNTSTRHQFWRSGIFTGSGSDPLNLRNIGYFTFHYSNDTVLVSLAYLLPLKFNLQCENLSIFLAFLFLNCCYPKHVVNYVSCSYHWHWIIIDRLCVPSFYIVTCSLMENSQRRHFARYWMAETSRNL